MTIYELPILSRVSLFIVLALMVALALIIWGWQIVVLRGKSMQNADGSHDDWREQRLFYGIAVADIFLACPATLAAATLMFISLRWGYYLLIWISCWFVWANVMTTMTSLRFEKPKLTLMWFIQFPFGALVGLAAMAWTVVHYQAISVP